MNQVLLALSRAVHTSVLNITSLELHGGENVFVRSSWALLLKCQLQFDSWQNLGKLTAITVTGPDSQANDLSSQEMHCSWLWMWFQCPVPLTANKAELIGHIRISHLMSWTVPKESHHFLTALSNSGEFSWFWTLWPSNKFHLMMSGVWPSPVVFLIFTYGAHLVVKVKEFEWNSRTDGPLHVYWGCGPVVQKTVPAPPIPPPGNYSWKWNELLDGWMDAH